MKTTHTQTKHTEVNYQGNWDIVLKHNILANPSIMVGKKVIAEFPDWRGDSFDRLTKEESDANQLLIASAPQGLKVSIKTYVKLLMTPSDLWRAQNQDAYVDLREFIADATGNTSRYVQEFFEQVAYGVKFHNMSIEESIANQVNIFVL